MLTDGDREHERARRRPTEDLRREEGLATVAGIVAAGAVVADVNALQGRLADGVLSNLIQYLSLNQASGCLTVTTPGLGIGEVYLVRGRVQHAVFGRLVGVAAVAQLLGWTQGRFSFRVGVVPPAFTIDQPTDQLLLNAAYHVDVEGMRPRPDGRSAMPDPTPLVDPQVIPGLVWAAIASAGPIGEIFVDEAFDALGHSPRLVPESELGALVQAIAGHFKSASGQRDFIARAEAVLEHHGYGRVEEQ